MHVLLRAFFVAVALLSVCLPQMVVADQGSQAAGGVVKVGNLVITQTDIDIRAQEILPMQVSFHGALTSEKLAEVKGKALNDLVARAYKVQYAINEEISIDAKSFESEWQKKFGNVQKPTDQAQVAMLSKVKANLYLDLLARKAETIAVDAKVTVTDEMVAAYYAKNKEKYFRPKLFKASHVFVRVDPSSNAAEQKEKRARAEELFKRAQAGEDFYNLAYYESDDRSRYVGGSLGSFHAGQTVAEFDAAIQAMKPGEIVGPIRTIYGFHVIKLDTVEEERQLQYDEVSAKIRASLTESEREKIYESWMAALKEKYPFERLVK